MTLNRSVSTPILAAFLLLGVVITGNALVGLWGVQRLAETSRRVGNDLAPLSQVAMQVVVHSAKAGEARIPIDIGMVDLSFVAADKCERRSPSA